MPGLAGHLNLQKFLKLLRKLSKSMRIRFLGDRLIVELGFRVRISSWIFELDFQVDFPNGFSSWIFKLVFDLVSVKYRLQTRGKMQTKE